MRRAIRRYKPILKIFGKKLSWNWRNFSVFFSGYQSVSVIFAEKRKIQWFEVRLHFLRSRWKCEIKYCIGSHRIISSNFAITLWIVWNHGQKTGNLFAWRLQSDFWFDVKNQNSLRTWNGAKIIGSRSTVWKFRDFLSLKFYVKSNLRNLKVQKLPFLQF